MEHVTSSVASHGQGIISVAISSFFRFLTEKTAFLSELLQDNCVRSHSMNEVNFWKVCTFLIIFLNCLFDIPILEVNHHMIRLVVIENGMGIITYINY